MAIVHTPLFANKVERCKPSSRRTSSHIRGVPLVVLRRALHALRWQDIVSDVRATLGCVALLFELHEGGLVNEVVLVVERTLADFLLSRPDVRVRNNWALPILPILGTDFCNGWQGRVVLSRTSTLVDSFAQAIIVVVINGHLVLGAGREVRRLRELLLCGEILCTSWLLHAVHVTPLEVRCTLLARHCDLDATATPWTHFALPFARHRLIEHGLLTSLLRLRTLARSLLGVCFHGSFRDILVTHALLFERIRASKLVLRRLALLEVSA